MGKKNPKYKIVFLFYRRCLHFLGSLFHNGGRCLWRRTPVTLFSSGVYWIKPFPSSHLNPVSNRNSSSSWWWWSIAAIASAMRMIPLISFTNIRSVMTPQVNYSLIATSTSTFLARSREIYLYLYLPGEPELLQKQA